jgi:hypothetical protein
MQAMHSLRPPAVSSAAASYLLIPELEASHFVWQDCFRDRRVLLCSSQA